MHNKGSVAIVIALSLLVAFASLSGCGGKKQTQAPPPAPAPAPEPAPAPAPTPRPAAPKTQEDRVPSDLSFSTVYFDFDKSEIRADMRNTMNENARLMNRYKTVRVRIEGHCDERGTNEYNMALGQRRADIVKQYLIDYGISASRIQTVSYGEERPVDPRHNEDAWSKNRRSEIVITGK